MCKEGICVGDCSNCIFCTPQKQQDELKKQNLCPNCKCDKLNHICPDCGYSDDDTI